MDDAPPMRVPERLRDLAHQANSHRRQGSVPSRVEAIPHSPPSTYGMGEPKNRPRRRSREPRGCSGAEPCGESDLAVEALGPEQVREVGVKDLECHRAVVLQITGEIDRSHPAAAELTLERVTVAQSLGERD